MEQAELEIVNVLFSSLCYVCLEKTTNQMRNADT